MGGWLINKLIVAKSFILVVFLVCTGKDDERWDVQHLDFEKKKVLWAVCCPFLLDDPLRAECDLDGLLLALVAKRIRLSSIIPKKCSVGVTTTTSTSICLR